MPDDESTTARQAGQVRTRRLAVLGAAGGAVAYQLLHAAIRIEPSGLAESLVRAEPAAGVSASPPAGVIVPTGMVYVPGGRTIIGADDGMPDERPRFVAEVRPFLMDVHPVTVAEFRRFVEATGHRTDAERVGDAGVYESAVDRWLLVPGATWHHPRGPDKPPAPGDHPVTQVSWHDAAAYARWAGKRLPTEIEWEHAARGGRDAREPYAWGAALAEQGRQRANTWHGVADRGEHGSAAGGDGHVYTSPVGAFGATPLGLTDMGGNVWQWTADWFRSYDERDEQFRPDSTSERAQRGGSFLCHRDVCHGYRVSARSHSTPGTALFHVGFRLVQDVPPPAAGTTGAER